MSGDTQDTRVVSPPFRYDLTKRNDWWKFDEECPNPPHPSDINIADMERVQLVEEDWPWWISAKATAEKVSGMDLNLGQYTAEWLLSHQRNFPIPASWHEGYTLFPATRWRKVKGTLKGTFYVPCLYWEAREWRLDFFTWLRFGSGRHAHVARLKE